MKFIAQHRFKYKEGVFKNILNSLVSGSQLYLLLYAGNQLYFIKIWSENVCIPPIVGIGAADNFPR